MPSKIILVRHGEEPLVEEGRELSKRGWARANALPKLFAKQQIAHLIALKPHKKTGSIRSIQTLQPISAALKLEIQTPYDRDEVADLVELVSNHRAYDGKVVLIAWQHETLADIAREFGASKAPNKWGKAFDRYWVLKFQNDNLVSFENLPQRLLPGDSSR